MENRKSIEKINETKRQFFGKLSRISKPPGALIRKKERMQVMGIRNERGNVKREQTATMGPKDSAPRERRQRNERIHLYKDFSRNGRGCFLMAPSWNRAMCLCMERVRSTRWAPLRGYCPATGRGRPLRCTIGRNLKTVIPNERSQSQEYTVQEPTDTKLTHTDGKPLGDGCRVASGARKAALPRRLYYHRKPGPGCARVHMLSHAPLCATLWTVARQAPLSTGFSR